MAERMLAIDEVKSLCAVCRSHWWQELLFLLCSFSSGMRLKAVVL